MNITDFIDEFNRFLKKTPTKDQNKALEKFCQFINPQSDEKIFVLNGYAGTGKTSLVAALVNMLETYGLNCILMAPTGRAAKVLSKYANHQAFTIHKVIFRQNSMDINADVSINFNKNRNVLFVVDEASMINNVPSESILRDGLLQSLLNFVFQTDNGCKLLLVGDNAQLPPVGQLDSPALQKQTYANLGFYTSAATLRTVVRQEQMSGILMNATNIRYVLENSLFDQLPKIRFTQFADVKAVPGDELIDTLADFYERDGIEETMVVCRSNKTANIYNNGIRNRILWREDELESGEFVMVAKNNYYWTAQTVEDSNEPNRKNKMDFIANGDIAKVQRVRNVREFYGFRFADCTLEFPDYDDEEFDITVILDTLQAEAPALNEEQQERLFNKVMEDYFDVPLKTDKLKKLKQDPYYNALQIKYAYAVTCHKAQGGQWTNIFVDQGFIPEDTDIRDYCRWLYTAMTRATKRLFLVNWKQKQTDG